jgi:hypothetical protein
LIEPASDLPPRLFTLPFRFLPPTSTASNVGKSSVFNRLIAADRASISGIPVRLIDVAILGQ